MRLLLFMVWTALLLGVMRPLHPRERAYHAFWLNPQVDWTRPDVQETWRVFGGAVGRFLSTEAPLTLHELVVLCTAYETQHSSSGKRPVNSHTVDSDLQNLFETGIVIVGEWQAFPTSPISTGPLRVSLPKRNLPE